MKYLAFALLILSITFSCKENEQKEDGNCPDQAQIIDSIKDGEKLYLLTSQGDIWLNQGSGCSFYDQYFEPDFLSKNYLIDGNNIFHLWEGGQKINIKKTLADDFENYQQYTDIFISGVEDTAKNWMDMVLLSPAFPTIDAYVSLRKCIMNHTCNFVDNRIDLSADPVNSANKAIKFFSIAPTSSMITAKSSIENTLLFADRGDEVNYEARYYISKGMPETILDLENKWFDESPGIRLMLLNDDYLVAELKYGLKPLYRQIGTTNIGFPKNQWVKLKVYFLLDCNSNGIVKVWQNDVLIIDQKGQTLPTSNSIQTNIEIGITACDQETEMYMDDVKVSVIKH